MRILTLVIASLISLATAAPIAIEIDQCEFTVGQVIETSSGPVAGHAAKDFPDVSEYLGIPFGQAPIGDLRFAAPVKYTSSVLNNASHYGPSCATLPKDGVPPSAEAITFSNITAVGLNLIGEIWGGFGNKSGEDCLYLNVWTKSQLGEEKKAVMIFFHGGGFSGGSSSDPATVGAKLANDQDVIVVSFNYRVSILGFPGNPDSQNNLAFLDQRLAAEWVRENIENFGGDPERITFFGQSAGAASVDYISYAFADDPIAAGIILQSGTSFGLGLPYPAASSAAAWYTVTEILGCGNACTESNVLLSCMRNVDVDTLMAAVPRTGLSAILSAFAPTVDNKLVFANYSEQKPADIPVLVGSNDYEAGIFRTELALGNMTYPDFAWDLLGLASFSCPAGARANASAAFTKPTWRYRYFAVFPDVDISPQAGAYHGIEIQPLFGTTPTYIVNATAEEIVFETYLRGAWTSFAKDPVNGLLSYEDGWPTYDSADNTLIRLGYNNSVGTNVVLPREYDYPCAYSTMEQLLALLG